MLSVATNDSLTSDERKINQPDTERLAQSQEHQPAIRRDAVGSIHQHTTKVGAGKDHAGGYRFTIHQEQVQMNLPTAYIYGLAEPGTSTIRYVGQTVDPKIRRKCHERSGHFRGGNKSLRDWLSSIRSKGKQPRFIILEACPVSEAANRETYFIKFFRNKGNRLLNRLDGARHTYKSCYDHFVKCTETGDVFESMSSAARAVGVSPSTIRNYIEKGDGFEKIFAAGKLVAT